MKVGITGTRNGLTEKQRISLIREMTEMNIFEFHHGDCVGVDAQAAHIAHNLGARVICHPPLDESLRAFYAVNFETREAKCHFARNRDIVNDTEVLIVCPMQMEWQPKGGTWYTHDYAIKRWKTVIVIWPDGTVEAGDARRPSVEGWPLPSGE